MGFYLDVHLQLQYIGVCLYLSVYLYLGVFL